MDADKRAVVSLVFTGILVICALVVTGLIGQVVFQRYWLSTPTPRTDSHASDTRLSHRLPELTPPFVRHPSQPRLELPETVRGFPLVTEFATIVKVANRDMLFIPILMNEGNLPVEINSMLVDPLKWKDPDPFGDVVVGRRSIWFMEVGTTMLYGVLLDPYFGNGSVGSGFVSVRRVSEDTYDVILEDVIGAVLFAARGNLEKLDPSIGRGTLWPVEDQDEVHRLYNPRWELDPSTFLLFAAQ